MSKSWLDPDLPRPRGARTALLAVLLTVTGVFVMLIQAVAAPRARAADPVTDAVSSLRDGSLYVDPTVSGVSLDQSAVRNALPSGVKIAVLPASSGDPTSLADSIGKQLDPNASEGLTVGVLQPNRFAAGSSRLCRGVANREAQAAVTDNKAQLQSTGNATALVEDFARRVESAQPCASGAGSDVKKSGGTSGWVVFAVVVVILALLGVGLFGFTRRRRKRRLDDARARVMPYYDRLADDLNTLDPGDNERARQAISDASQRFTSAGSQLATADSVEKYALARRTVVEGLYSTRAARVALGLDPGADLPALDGSTAPQLSAPQQVTVQGQTFQGYPNYSPNSPYYYGGGYGVPGGWYANPFWETLLIGSVLSGGFGGGWGWGGGGFGGGYDAGYESGYDAGRDNAGNGDQGAGDWGSGGGGGDWGSGGGDWGSGGGDWGGGGGDSGGSW